MVCITLPLSEVVCGLNVFYELNLMMYEYLKVPFHVTDSTIAWLKFISVVDWTSQHTRQSPCLCCKFLFCFEECGRLRTEMQLWQIQEPRQVVHLYCFTSFGYWVFKTASKVRALKSLTCFTLYKQMIKSEDAPRFKTVAIIGNITLQHFNTTTARKQLDGTS